MTAAEETGSGPIVTSKHRPVRQTDRSAAALLVGLLVWLLTLVGAIVTALQLPGLANGSWKIAIGVVLWALVVICVLVALPLAGGMGSRNRAKDAEAAGDEPKIRVRQVAATRRGWTAAGLCVPLLFLLVFAQFLAANHHAVQGTFFDVPFMVKSLKKVTVAFGQNIGIAVVAEVIVLVWALVVALLRMLPGAGGKPIRWLATVYIDIFRAVPSIIVIYLIGFGLPLADIPILSDLGTFWSPVLALALTYGAYVSEVYRSGIDGIHPSQVSASRSLGLSYGKTMRFVVIPQAVRRVLPPLLNDFIGLQKDTALVTIIGTVDAFTQAKIYSSNYFNLSSVTVVAILFIIITIPQTRLVDWLMTRDNRGKARN